MCSIIAEKIMFTQVLVQQTLHISNKLNNIYSFLCQRMNQMLYKSLCCSPYRHLFQVHGRIAFVPCLLLVNNMHIAKYIVIRYNRKYLLLIPLSTSPPPSTSQTDAHHQQYSISVQKAEKKKNTHTHTHKKTVIFQGKLLFALAQQNGLRMDLRFVLNKPHYGLLETK